MFTNNLSCRCAREDVASLQKQLDDAMDQLDKTATAKVCSDIAGIKHHHTAANIICRLLLQSKASKQRLSDQQEYQRCTKPGLELAGCI